MKTPAQPNPGAERVAMFLARRIGKRLQAARMAACLSRLQAAAEAKLQRDTILRVEQGDPSVSLRNLVRICRALKLDARDVLGR